MKDKSYYLNQEGENIFYVYIHRRLSDGKPFYVGKGKWGRAWEAGCTRRSSYWTRVKNKHGMVVEIYKDSLSDKESLREEIKLIALLREEGIQLTNLTDGGDGASGSKRTPEQIQRLSSSIQNKTVYTFLNLDTKNVFIGTRSEFTSYSNNHRRVADFLCNDRIGSVSKGWYLINFTMLGMRGEVPFHVGGEFYEESLKEGFSVRKGSPENIRKMSASKVDTTIYLFAHTITGELLHGTREDLKTRIGVDAAPLFKKKKRAATLKSWVLVRDGNIERSILIGLNKGWDKIQKYRFRNFKTGEELVCSRLYFKKHTGISSTPLFKTNPQTFVKGWQVFESIVEEL